MIRHTGLTRVHFKWLFQKVALLFKAPIQAMFVTGCYSAEELFE